MTKEAPSPVAGEDLRLALARALADLTALQIERREINTRLTHPKLHATVEKYATRETATLNTRNVRAR